MVFSQGFEVEKDGFAYIRDGLFFGSPLAQASWQTRHFGHPEPALSLVYERLSHSSILTPGARNRVNWYRVPYPAPDLRDAPSSTNSAHSFSYRSHFAVRER